jgi:hypothetical protein
MITRFPSDAQSIRSQDGALLKISMAEKEKKERRGKRRKRLLEQMRLGKREKFREGECHTSLSKLMATPPRLLGNCG